MTYICLYELNQNYCVTVPGWRFADILLLDTKSDSESGSDYVRLHHFLNSWKDII